MDRASLEKIAGFIVFVAVSGLMKRRKLKEDCRSSVLQGEPYFEELLNGHDRRFEEFTGMEKTTFIHILGILEGRGLRASRALSCGQKFAILLHLLRGHSNRSAQETFQHSVETISRVMHGSC